MAVMLLTAGSHKVNDHGTGSVTPWPFIHQELILCFSASVAGFHFGAGLNKWIITNKT